MTRLTYKQDKISEHDIAERVRLHMPLARKIAWQMHGRVRDLFEIEDLIQIGMTTLVEAAQRFQDTGEASFGTYASVRVRGALVDHLRSHLAMTRTAVQRRNRIESAELAVRQRGEDPSDVNVMMKELGISLIEYDHSVWFADDGPTPESALIDDETRKKLVENLKKLNEREALVLQLYYVEELNLEEISEVMSVTVGRVSQIKKAALSHLRKNMQEAS